MKPRRLPPPLDRFVPDGQAALFLLASLLLATLYWAVTVGQEKALKDFTVPVEFAGLAADRVVTGEFARGKVTVEVRGTPDLLRRVREEDVEARVDVSRLQNGPQVFELGEENVRLPSPVEFVRVFPPVVHFSVDRRASRTLPLEPNFAGRCPRGLQVTGWSVDPSQVTVQGPEGLLSHLQRVLTQPVPLDGRNQDFETSVIPVPQEPDVTVVEPQTHQLRVSIGEQRVQRALAPVGVTVVGAPAGLAPAVSPSSLKVMVEGPESVVNGLKPSDLTAEVDVRGLSPSSQPYQLRPAVRLADPGLRGRVEVTSWIQRFVDVRLERRSAAEAP